MNQDSPVAAAEILLRRIVREPGQYDPKTDPPIFRGAFTPNKNDRDGLSLFREAFVSAQALASGGRRPVSDYVVARLRVGEVLELGLTVVPSLDPGGIPGHVIIPELSLARYEQATHKNRIKELAVLLARIASQDVVQFQPS